MAPKKVEIEKTEFGGKPLVSRGLFRREEF